MQKKYDINDYFWSKIGVISEPYEGYCQALGANTMMHHISYEKKTLLLYQKNKYTDLRNPERKFYIPRDGEEKSYTVLWAFSLGECLKQIGVSISSCTPKEALRLVKENIDFLETYTARLRVEESIKQEEENLLKLGLTPQSFKSIDEKR